MMTFLDLRPIVVAVLFYATSAPVLAQDDLSNRYATASLSAMLSGDRNMAIALALRGLPADPTEADMERFSDAHDALFRAVAARNMQIQSEGYVSYTVNSTGDRAVIGAGGDRTQIALYDPRDDSHIADLVDQDVVISFVYGPGKPPVFSPDGKLVALWAMDESQVLIFDTADGRPHPPLEASGEPGGIAGFSPDGTKLVATGDEEIFVWDLETRERIEGAWPESSGQVVWTGDGNMVTTSAETANYEISAVILESFDSTESLGSVRIEASGPRFLAFPSPKDSSVLVEIDNDTFLADPVAGTSMRIGAPDTSAWRYLRGGDALGVLSVAGHTFTEDPRAYKLTVVDLEGNPLMPTRHDWVPFDQYVIAPFSGLCCAKAC